jgi:hypothetical protein
LLLDAALVVTMVEEIAGVKLPHTYDQQYADAKRESVW